MSFLSELRDVHEPAHTPPGQSPSSASAVQPDQAPPAVARAGTRHPYVKAFACAGVTYLVATAVLLAVLLYRVLPRATTHQVGDVTAGALLFFSLACVVPAVLTGLIVSQSPRVWPVRQIALLFLPMFVLAVALQALHAVSG